MAAWTAARGARYGSRFEHHQRLPMRLLRPATVVVGRPRRAARTGWRSTAQIHVTLQSVSRQAAADGRPARRPSSSGARRGGDGAGPPGSLVWQDVLTTIASGARLPARRVVRRTPADLATTTRAAGDRLQRIVEQALTETVRVANVSSRRHVEDVAAAAIAQRVAKAGQRIEAPAAGRNLAFKTAQPAVVVSSAVASGAAQTPQAEAVAGGPRHPRGAGAQTATGALPVDVERLTDQVVRAIDRRILAHRERTGTLF